MDKQVFDPAKYLTKLGTADYLEVKWRLVWLRSVHPDAQIETEVEKCIPPGTDPETGERLGWALFRARVSIPNAGSATGWGSEGISDFRDFLEKAETKALGRALAALGFGTQFSGGELESTRIADSPVDFASTRGRRMPDNQSQPAPPDDQAPPQNYQSGGQGSGNNYQNRPANQGSGPPAIANPGAPASPNQMKFVTDLLKNNGYDVDQMDLNGFTKGEASTWIESLNKTGRVPQDPKA